VARCVKLDGFAGILAEPTQTDTVFAKEISDRVRVVACLTTLPNIAYSDDGGKNVSARSWKAVRELAGAGPDDGVVLTWGGRADADCGANEIVIRARELTEGVPSETRQALDDGTTGFERILPGPDRMYPDTDLPPMALSRERVERIRRRVPEPVWEREERLAKLGLSDDVIAKLVTSARLALFWRLVCELKVEPKLAGEVVARRFTALSRRGLDPGVLGDDLITEVFAAYQDGRVAREGIVPVLEWLIETETGEAADPAARVGAALGALGFTPVERDDLVAIVANTAESFNLSEMRKPEAAHTYLMGVLMEKLAGRAEGARVARHLEAALRSAGGV
jgi:glutamyl-tRNA(Gln) amidotransferase subunit E